MSSREEVERLRATLKWAAARVASVVLRETDRWSTVDGIDKLLAEYDAKGGAT